MADYIRPTPRNPILGLLADAMMGGLAYMEDPRRTQQMRGVGGLLSDTGIAQTVERLAYGEPLTKGKGFATRMKPETAAAAMTLAPEAVPIGRAAMGAARAAERGAMAVGRAGERYAEKVVPQIMERGGLPAEMVAAMGQGTQSPLTVYHGSPYRFNRFDPTKIGSGEGAQAYGYGHYVAESPRVAKEYQEKLSKSVTVDGQKLTSIPSDSPMAEAQNMVVRAIQDGMTPQQAIAHTKKYWMDAADEMVALKQSHPELAERIDSEAASRRAVAAATNSMRPESFFKDPGSLYTINLPDSAIARMLDWDKPLSEQGRIMDVLKPRVEKNPEAWGQEQWLLNIDLPGRLGKSIDALRTKREAKEYLEMITGERLYQSLDPTMGPRNSAEALRAAGIPGIRYLDRGSRGAGQGTSNFVIFPGEEDLLRILSVNGGLLTP